MSSVLYGCREDESSGAVLLGGQQGTVSDVAALVYGSGAGQAQPLRVQPAMAPRDSPAPHDANSEPAAAPVYTYQPCGTPGLQLHTLLLPLDVLCYVPGSSRAEQLAAACVLPALLRQLATARAVMLEQAQAQRGLLQVRICHFVPHTRAHHVTVAYPCLSDSSEADEAKMMPLRCKGGWGELEGRKGLEMGGHVRGLAGLVRSRGRAREGQGT